MIYYQIWNKRTKRAWFFLYRLSGQKEKRDRFRAKIYKNMKAC